MEGRGEFAGVCAGDDDVDVFVGCEFRDHGVELLFGHTAQLFGGKADAAGFVLRATVRA